MAGARGRNRPSLESALLAQPHRFEFHQAVRILLRMRPGAGVGGDGAPRFEAVRFRAQGSFRLAASGIAAVTSARAADEAPELLAAFLGLIGAEGALPEHYTELVLRRLRLRDRTLREFLDLFHHRTMSHRHRAWEKYRFAVSYERAAETPGTDDPITASLYATVGRGTRGLRNRLALHDEVFLEFAGHFSRRARPAVCLAAILSDYFEVPVAVEQFRGEWLTLAVSERTQLPSQANPHGNHNRLGVDTIVGRHSFDVQGGLRLRVGPVRYESFRRFMPTGDLLKPFCHLARSYVGPELAFDVRPVLAAREAPRHCLGQALGPSRDDVPRLGWNTWLLAEPLAREFSGVSFSLDPA
jgi:type VI secretion system protein ImpH